jgi:hypothetical protein
MGTDLESFVEPNLRGEQHPSQPIAHLGTAFGTPYDESELRSIIRHGPHGSIDKDLKCGIHDPAKLQRKMDE